MPDSADVLGRDEAATRAGLLADVSYDVELDLGDGRGDTFLSATSVSFRCTEPGASTFVDVPFGPLVSATLDACGDALHCARDATRGGIATVLNEIALSTRLGVVIDEQALPLRPEVVGAGEILGIDPHADAALEAMRAQAAGEAAAIIGEVRDEPEGRVLGRTTFGGHRMIDMLVGDPLPRIC